MAKLKGIGSELEIDVRLIYPRMKPLFRKVGKIKIFVHLILLWNELRYEKYRCKVFLLRYIAPVCFNIPNKYTLRKFLIKIFLCVIRIKLLRKMEMFSLTYCSIVYYIFLVFIE